MRAMAAARAAPRATLLLALWAASAQDGNPPNYELARDHDNLKPLQEYLEYRWVDVAVGGENVRLRVGHGAALDGLYAETCAAVAAGDARCVGELQEYVEAELRRDPTFYGAASEAIATNRSEGFAPRDAYEARVEIVSPAQGARTAARSDTLAFTWRLAGAPFELGVDGVACVAMYEADKTQPLSHRCFDTLEDSVDGYQRLSVFNAAPGEYTLVAQLRGVRNADARGPLALRRAVLVATGPALDAVPRDRLTAETLGRYYENVTRAPWLSAALAAAPSQGATVAPEQLSGDLDVLFRYDARLASLAARDLGLASARDLVACVRVGTPEENDVGHLAGCVSLSPRADDPASHEASALLRVGALLAQPLLVDALTKVRSDGGAGDGALALTAHAEARAGPPRAASATATTLAAVGGGSAADAPSGFADLDALRSAVRSFETHIGGSFEKPRKQRALRAAVEDAALRRAPARPLYCEVGFNAGYSASAALSAGADVIALDVATIGAVHAGVDFLRAAFPERTVELLAGESCRNLERGATLSPTWAGGRRCDVVFVDGDHFFGPADCDLRLLSRFSRAGAAVFADDVRFDCEESAHAALCGGPLRAWNGTLRDGVVRETACDDEGFCAGAYVRADFAEPEAGSYRVSVAGCSPPAV